MLGRGLRLFAEIPLTERIDLLLLARCLLLFLARRHLESFLELDGTLLVLLLALQLALHLLLFLANLGSGLLGIIGCQRLELFVSFVRGLLVPLARELHLFEFFFELFELRGIDGWQLSLHRRLSMFVVVPELDVDVVKLRVLEVGHVEHLF